MAKYLRMSAAILAYLLIYFFLNLFTEIIALSSMMLGGSGIDILYDNEILELISFNTMPLFLLFFFIVCYGIFRAMNLDFIAFCRFKRFRIRYILPIILISIFTTGISLVFIQYGIVLFPDYAEVSNSYSMAAQSMIGILGIVVFAPLIEEILFRGMIFNRLRQDMNVIIAAVIQAIIFGIMHGNMLQFIYTFALGLVMAYIYVKTDSLWMSILVHMTYNLFGVAVFPNLLEKFNIPIILFGVINVVLLIGSFVYFNFMVKIEGRYN